MVLLTSYYKLLHNRLFSFATEYLTLGVFLSSSLPGDFFVINSHKSACSTTLNSHNLTLQWYPTLAHLLEKKKKVNSSIICKLERDYNICIYILYYIINELLTIIYYY